MYIGEKNGIEEDLVGKRGIAFRGIYCGKLRRYFDVKNFIDIFKIPVGIVQSFFILRGFKPDIVFIKGGYVTVPVAFAAWILKIPVIIHESDVSPGLATRICARFAKKILLSWQESLAHFAGDARAVVCGNPVRSEIMAGRAERGYAFTNFTNDKPIVLIMGGSTGAAALNTLVTDSLDRLLEFYNVIHITGRGKGSSIRSTGTTIAVASSGMNIVASQTAAVDSHGTANASVATGTQYVQFEYIDSELPDVYAITNLVISRAGANALSEIALLGLPSILIPLPQIGSRGDQLENAAVFQKSGASLILDQGTTTAEIFISAVQNLLQSREKLTEMATKAHQLARPDASGSIADVLKSCSIAK